MSSKKINRPTLSFSNDKKRERKVSDTQKESKDNEEKKKNKEKYPDNSVLQWWSSIYFDYLKQEANNPDNPHPLMASLEVEVVKEA
ncbi:MAG TPA: hypothetical protein PK707_03025, partial [Candidatus Syntrophosphaera thermopropionivorans]|nr:hypothetical protein [Candidatus Syntrophosphaera thermopropionivorans]